jgi:hypothetical protein
MVRVTRLVLNPTLKLLAIIIAMFFDKVPHMGGPFEHLCKNHHLQISKSSL